MRVDKITVYRTTTNGFRWSRRTTSNGKIVGASTEEYRTVRAAMKNIERTQKGPFELVKQL